jgi:hypothetical protein
MTVIEHPANLQGILFWKIRVIPGKCCGNQQFGFDGSSS